MKKFFYAALFLLTFATTSCEEKKQVETNVSNERIDSLQRVITQKDNDINDMMLTLNEIQEGLNAITRTENEVSIVKDGESTNKAQQIREKISFINNKMAQNRELIEKLRKQLRQSSINSEQLKATIEGLSQQLASKEQEILQLRSELEQKDIHIAELDKTVETLHTDVNTLTEESAEKSQTISRQDKQLNTAWYVFGTKKELKDQHIIESDRVLQANFNKSYFTKIDIRIDKEIKLYSKSATIMTNHPASSYVLQRDANKQYILRITNPEAFWSTSKYLVVLVK